jgi:hypothetical protein
MKIGPDETVLTGKWIEEEGRIVGDETERRIFELTRNYLVFIARDVSGWDALYRDPGDGRLWEQIYPQSELQGGGPQQLRLLVEEQAMAKFNLTADQISN